MKNYQDFLKKLLEKVEEGKELLTKSMSQEDVLIFLANFYYIAYELQAEIENAEKCSTSDFVKKNVANSFSKCTECSAIIAPDGFMTISASGWLYNKNAEKNNNKFEKLKPESFSNINSSINERTEIFKSINECLKIINENSDVDFLRIQKHLLDILNILSE